tara:strand:- start:318 stop:581 length:264 start_codon:yes stop_codon:yes gene_type:complete
MPSISPASPTDIELTELTTVQSFSVDINTGLTDIIKKVTQTSKETGAIHSVRTIRETIETPSAPDELKALIDYAVQNAPEKPSEPEA